MSKAIVLQFAATGDVQRLADDLGLSDSDLLGLLDTMRRVVGLDAEARRRFAYGALIGLTSRGLGANSTPDTYATQAWLMADAMMAREHKKA